MLIVIGALVVILGLGWSWFRHVPLFRLPGDIVIDRPGFKFFMPITTMLLLSALISLVAWVLRRLSVQRDRGLIRLRGRAWAARRAADGTA